MDGKDDIEMENDFRNDSREDDPDYDVEVEEDKGEFEDQAYDELPGSMDRFENIADSAPPILEDEMMVSTSEIAKKGGSKRKRGRGPTKGIKVKEPMYLEYNKLGQPCGRWRGKYGTQIGLCMRKLSILWSWSEVPEDLKEKLWEDTMNLFHIQPDEAKKDVFLSAVAERFRDFKSKLVSGWITFKRDRTQAKKMRKEKEKETKGEESENKERRENEKGKENEEEEEEQHEKENEGIKNASEKKQAPVSMPYEIWHHISKDDWEAFVAKKTAPQEIEKRGKASINAKKKKYFHRMGPKTFDEKRKEWINEGLYPNLSSSVVETSSSPITAVKVDRVADWYCSLHGQDASGRRAIVDPAVRKVADEVIGWKHKEAMGEFTPRANMDALYMVLGKDHKGRVKGKGGVRLGAKKAFGEEYLATGLRSSVNAPQDLEAMKAKITDELVEKMEKKFTAILERTGLPCLESLHAVPEDKLSQQNPSMPIEVPNETLKPPVPELEEETPCHLSLPKSGVVCGELIEVAYGRAQPPNEDQKVHTALIAGDQLNVCIDTVVSGFEHFSLPVPRPEWNLQSLADAQDSSVTWPCAWVRFTNEKIKKAKAKNLNTKEEGLQGNKEDSRSKKIYSQVKGKRAGSHANEKEVDSKAIGKKGDSEAKEKKIDSQPENAKIQELSSNCSNPVEPKAIPLVDAQVLESLSKACLWLHMCITNLLNEDLNEDLVAIGVILDKFQFHYTVDTPMRLSKLDICLFLSGERLSASILLVFMSALYEDLNDRESVVKVGWLCPEKIDDLHCLESLPRVKEYIETVISESLQAGHKFIIAPSFEDHHWLLLVISLSTHTIYQFDPERQEPPRNLLIKSLLNSVMKKGSGRGLQRAILPRWKSMKCAQQEAFVESGYYVMRYMYDLISCCSKVDDLEKIFNPPRETPFTAEEIDEVRDKVAWFLTGNCF